jgi:hypothetical protein
MTMTAHDNNRLVEQVRELARTREHRLAVRQLANLDKMTTTSLVAMRTYLDGRPLRADAPAPADIAAAVHAATAAATAAVAQAPRAHQGRGGTRITQEGIYYYDKRVYKVIKSQYSGHWQARRLNPDAKGPGRWTYIEGMMGVLRAEHKMTAEDSREYERLYGYPTCTDCGAPLENDLSRARRKGPVCYGKNGPNPGTGEDEQD